jgi:hypothetical protein
MLTSTVLLLRLCLHPERAVAIASTIDWVSPPSASCHVNAPVPSAW